MTDCVPIKKNDQNKYIVSTNNQSKQIISLESTPTLDLMRNKNNTKAPKSTIMGCVSISTLINVILIIRIPKTTTVSSPLVSIKSLPFIILIILYQV